MYKRLRSLSTDVRISMNKKPSTQMPEIKKSDRKSDPKFLCHLIRTGGIRISDQICDQIFLIPAFGYTGFFIHGRRYRDHTVHSNHIYRERTFRRVLN